MMTATFGELQPADVRPLARLHRRAFPAFFLSSLGESFLEEFYRGFLDDPTAVTVVGRGPDGAVHGAAVGTSSPAAFFARLLRRRWRGFVSASLRAVLRQPLVAPRLLGAVRYRGGADSPTSGALLSSICVDPDRRTQGLGGQLLLAWTQRASAAGARTAFLTTDADGNDAVNAFYQKHGWLASQRFTTPQGRAMIRYTFDLDGD
jgi:ribosomal protein S18 acetylase RimI-like enzyme